MRKLPGFMAGSPAWGAERGELAGIEVVELQEADAGAAAPR